MNGRSPGGRPEGGSSVRRAEYCFTILCTPLPICTRRARSVAGKASSPSQGQQDRRGRSGVLNTTRRAGSVIEVSRFGSLAGGHARFIPRLHVAPDLLVLAECGLALLIGTEDGLPGNRLLPLDCRHIASSGPLHRRLALLGHHTLPPATVDPIVAERPQSRHDALDGAGR